MPWTDARVTDALTTFGKVLDYVNDDHATLTWDQAAGKLVDGTRGIQRHGRLGQGLLHRPSGWKPDTDFGWTLGARAPTARSRS